MLSRRKSDDQAKGSGPAGLGAVRQLAHGRVQMVHGGCFSPWSETYTKVSLQAEVQNTDVACRG